jgi:hemin uptake protein HemP
VASTAEADPSCSGHRVVQSRDLFGTEREIVIVHGEEAYRLRITRTDKLILTK